MGTIRVDPDHRESQSLSSAASSDSPNHDSYRPEIPSSSHNLRTAGSLLLPVSNFQVSPGGYRPRKRREQPPKLHAPRNSARICMRNCPPEAPAHLERPGVQLVSCNSATHGNNTIALLNSTTKAFTNLCCCVCNTRHTLISARDLFRVPIS
jgi:hypothetical protein